MARPSVTTIAIVVLCVGAVAVVGAVAIAGVPLDGTEDPDDAAVFHADPDAYTGDGDLDAVEAWLGAWMNDQLAESAVEISEGQAEMARERLGEEYTQRLSQYVELADDEDEADAYEAARDDHDRLAELLDEYNATWDAYEAAVAQGDGDEAHALAREINALADEIEAISDRILERVEVVPLRPDAVDAVQRTSDTVSNESEQVRHAHFTETTLSLEAVDASVSFLKPAIIEGSLTTADGEPIANETVEFEVDGQAVFAETDGDGAFSLEYRPVDLALDDPVVAVAYVPDPASEYLGSEATVDLDVEQVEPTLVVDVDDLEAGYGEQVAGGGELTVDGEAVDGVTLDVYLDGTAVGEAQLADGSFSFDVEVPAEVGPGAVDLEVVLPFEDRALAGVSTVESVDIVETETAMTVDAAVDDDGDEIEVTGDIATADGQPVAEQSVRLEVGDVPPIAVETDETGAFEASVDAPDGEDEVEVVAVFDGDGTNLLGSQAETAVAVDAASPTTPWLALAGVAAVVLIVAGGLWYRRRSRKSTALDTEAREGATASTVQMHSPSDAETILDAAIDRYAEEAFDEAVVLGYGAMRRGLADHLEDGRGHTHWEFLEAMETVARDNGLSEADIERLAAATTAFERASFQVDSVSFEEATEVLDASRDVVSRSPGRRQGILGDD